jgi:hypothetical protein
MEDNNNPATIKKALERIRDLSQPGMPLGQEYFGTLCLVLDSLHYKVQKLEQYMGPSDAFIDGNDAPHRLR